MARDRNDIDGEREYDPRNERFRRERPWGYDDPYAGRSRSLGGDYGSGDESSGRFGELAHYDHISLRDIAVETVTDRKLSDALEDIRRGHLSGK